MISGGGVSTGNTTSQAVFHFRTQFYTVPAITSSTAATFLMQDVGFESTLSSIAFQKVGRSAMRVSGIGATGLTLGRGMSFYRDGSDTTWIMADARIGV